MFTEIVIFWYNKSVLFVKEYKLLLLLLVLLLLLIFGPTWRSYKLTLVCLSVRSLPAFLGIGHQMIRKCPEKISFFGIFLRFHHHCFFFSSIDAHYYCHQCVKKVWNMPEIIFQFLFVIYTFYHSQNQLVAESQPSGIWKGW